MKIALNSTCVWLYVWKRFSGLIFYRSTKQNGGQGMYRFTHALEFDNWAQSLPSPSVLLSEVENLESCLGSRKAQPKHPNATRAQDSDPLERLFHYLFF